MTTERPREITAHHLAGWAGVYVRQSSERQVEQNQGSAEYQRRQKRWALAWGWQPTRIKFYVDAGLSGTAAAHRPEFLSLREEITAGRLRAVFAADQSRLARNAVEWIDFLNLCRIRHVILVIDGRVIHSGEDGDAFSSSIVALVDEFENRKRRAVFERGRLGKIAAGKAITSPPTGYVSRKDGGWDLDPDRDVQVGIAEVFRVFQEQRSSARTVRRLLADGRLVPRRKPGRAVRWVRPSVRAVLGIVSNPVYSGRYVYRQRTADESRGRDRRGHTRIRVTKAHERLVIADHHPAYITQEQADEIRAIIDANAPSKSRRNLGPGSALLQGAIGCAKHQGRGMSVDYRGCQQNGREGPHYYHCHGDYEIGGAQCWVVPGKQLDRAVAQALFGKLAPPALEEICSGWAAAKRDVVQQRSGESLAVEQARRKVDDLRARYDAVSPALRNLAERLEVDLNDALHEYERAREQAGSGSSETDLFTDDAFEELIALCGDLPALFFADTTVHRDRKEIFRTLIDRVIVTAASPESVSFAIRWADGSQSTEGVAYTARHAHALIRRWAAEGIGNPEIARRLNELDLKTSRGRHWTTPTVWQVQDYEFRTRAAAQTKKSVSSEKCEQNL